MLGWWALVHFRTVTGSTVTGSMSSTQMEPYVIFTAGVDLNVSCLVLPCMSSRVCLWSCLVLSYLVLSCLVLSCLVLSCLVLSCLVLFCLVLSCLVLSCRVVSCLILPCLLLCFLVLSYVAHVFIVSRLVVSSRLFPSRLNLFIISVTLSHARLLFFSWVIKILTVLCLVS